MFLLLIIHILDVVMIKIKTCVVSSTFGPGPSGSASNPSQFLRKGTREKNGANDTLSRKHKEKRGPRKRSSPLKPLVPSRDDKPVLGARTKHNFITSNACKVILSSVPNKGNKEVDFMKKESFGKIPDYLRKIKEDLVKENEMIDDFVKQKKDENSAPDPQHTQMKEDERKELLNLLQKKRDVVNRNYQKICHRVTMETPGDVRRKESQEADLMQLESDIERLSRPGPLMIRMT